MRLLEIAVPPAWRDALGVLATVFGWPLSELYEIPLAELVPWLEVAGRLRRNGER